MSNNIPAKATWRRYGLPILIFLAVIGGLAWFTQYMPNWRARKQEESLVKKGEVGGPGLVFRRNRAIWDPKDPDYVKEFEKGKDGFYDFPIANPTSNEVELGAHQVSCDCTDLQIALVPDAAWEEHIKKIDAQPDQLDPHPEWPWKPLKRDFAAGFLFPPSSKAILRLAWSGRKAPGERLRLTVGLWGQPKGQIKQRAFTGLEVPLVMAYPMQFFPSKVHVGTLTQGAKQSAQFTVWSGTRDNLEITFSQRPKDDLFRCRLQPLPAEELKQLQERLAKENEFPSRVRVAYRLEVTVRENAPDPEAPGQMQQLDLGPFAFRVPMLLDQQPLPPEFPGPIVYGTVKGEIDVGGTESQGKIDLKTFPAKQGTRKTVIVWSGVKTDLSLGDHSPQLLEVTLRKKPAEATGTRMKWLLEVTVPPEAAAGSLPEDSAVYLKVQGPQPRQIRIPVLGSAVQG